MTVTDWARRKTLVSTNHAATLEEHWEPVAGGWPSPARSSLRQRRAAIFLATLVSDAAAIALSILLGYLVLAQIRAPSHLVRPPDVFVLLPAYLIGFVVFRGYRQDPQRLLPSLVADLGGTTQLLILGVVIALAEADVLGGRLNGRLLRVSEAVALAVPAIFLVPLCRSIVLRVLRNRRRWAPRVVIVGSGRLVDSIAGRLRRSREAVLVGVVNREGIGPSWLGTEADLAQVCARHHVDRILLTPTGKSPDGTLEAVQHLDPSVAVSLVPQFYPLLNFRSTVEELAGLPLVHVKPASLSAASRVLKRVFDVVVSAALIALLTPLWIALAILVKKDSPGPLFFRQERPGRHRKPFKIIKFRTMCVDAEERRDEVAELNEHADTPLFKVRDDPRLTAVGRGLRRRHLDELPQLFNVLMGHMSLVGPRPFPTKESEDLAPRRFEVKPGMTGLWQVSGRIDLSHEDLLYLDTVYVASWSFWWDIRILLQTPKVLLDRAGDGTVSPDEADLLELTAEAEVSVEASAILSRTV